MTTIKPTRSVRSGRAASGAPGHGRRPDQGTQTVERYLARLEARDNPADYMRALKIAVRWYCT